MHTLTFKAPDELNLRLEKFAALEERPKSYLIRKAIEAYLQEREEDEADYKAGMKALAEHDGNAISWEEVMKKNGMEG